MAEQQLNIDAIVKWIENSKNGDVQKVDTPKPTGQFESYGFIIGGFEFRVTRFTGTGGVSDTLYIREAMKNRNILTIPGNKASEVYFAAFHREKDYQATKKQDAIRQINKTLAELMK